MKETNNMRNNNMPTDHEISKCTYCGNIGNFKTEPILTPLHWVIGIALMLFWIVPKSISFVVGNAFISFLTLPLPIRLLAGIVAIIFVFVPGLKSVAIDTFLMLFDIVSGPTRWLIALAVGLIYFGTVIIVRFNKKKRDSICTNCKAHNRFTFNY